MPINIASGAVEIDVIEVNVVGKLALTWSRQFRSGLLERPASLLGLGWSCEYFATLTRTATGFEFTTATGVEIIDDPGNLVDGGERVGKPGAFLELFRDGRRYVIQQWNVTNGRVRRLCFTPDAGVGPWALSSIENLTGQALDLAWNDDGALATVTQRLERRALSFTYTPSGLIESVRAHGTKGEVRIAARYEYDGLGRLMAAFDAAGFANRYQYDARNRLSREIAKDGAVFSYQYDRSGRCIRMSGLDRYDERTLRYLDASLWTEVTNSRGHTTRYQRLPSGQIITEVNPVGGAQRTTYDPSGRIVSVTDPLGNTTTFEYDAFGNRCKIVDALGHAHAAEYNSDHQPLRYTDPAGNSWLLFYDESRRLVRTSDPEGGVFVLHYDSDGNIVEVIDPGGNKRQQHFVVGGVLQGFTDPKGNTTDYEPDGFGRLRRVTDPLGASTSFEYDSRGNTSLVVYPDGTREAIRYDAVRNVTEIVGRNGNATRYKYGTCGRLLERVDPLGRSTRFRWSSEPGQLVAIVNPAGREYRLEYSALDRVVAETSFDGRGESFEYDLAARCIARINALGERVGYRRDELGRVTAQLLSGAPISAFTYGAAGFVETAENPDSAIRFERDKLGRVVREWQNGREILRTFDATSQQTRLESDNHRVSYRYDTNGGLSSFQVDGHAQTRFERDVRGSETGRHLPGHVTLLQQFDAMAELERQVVIPELRTPVVAGAELSGPLIDRAYTRVGMHIAAIDDGHWGRTQFAYDPVKRLTSAIRERGASEHFVFDVEDNLERVQRGPAIESFVYENGSRLTQHGDISYQYDEQGRLTSKLEARPGQPVLTWKYQWDALDRLVRVSLPSAEEWRYSYDAFGRRIGKRSSTGRRLGFVWDRDAVLHELENDAVTASWVNSPGSFVPLCKVEGRIFYSVICDHLGTPRELIDHSGRVVWRADYESWGQIRQLQTDGVQCSIRFQGQWWDEETGLHYNRYRYYDPSIGRYISSDPLGVLGGLNQYSYVANPIHWIDPFGLEINTTADRTHVTYEGSKGGKPYVGYASMPGMQSGQDVVAYRYGNDYASEGLDGPPRVVFAGYGETLDESRGMKAIARGLEQRGYEDAVAANGGDRSKVANAQNPVGERNQNRDAYLEAADRERAGADAEEEEAEEEQQCCSGG